MKTERKKVLHIKYTLNPGGGCMVVYRFALLLKDRYRFDWMTYCLKGNDWAYKFTDLGGTVKFYRGPGGRNFLRSFWLYLNYICYIRRNRYTIVHVHTENPINVRFLICAFLGGAKKRIMHSHNNGSQGVKNNLRFKMNKWLVGLFATDYIACSQEAAEWMFPEKAMRKAVILKNGLDTDTFRFDPKMREQIREKCGLEDRQFVIGHIGRFVGQKNHEFLLEAFAEVVKADPDARLMLLGSGGLEQKIRDKIAELDIERQVLFVGQVDNVQNYMSAMDVLALPSLYEGLGMVNIEAQTNGLFCVVSDRVAKLAKVTDLLDFYSLENGPKRWAEDLLALKGRTVHREKYSEIVREAGWDMKDLAERLAEVYES